MNVDCYLHIRNGILIYRRTVMTLQIAIQLLSQDIEGYAYLQLGTYLLFYRTM